MSLKSNENFEFDIGGLYTRVIIRLFGLDSSLIFQLFFCHSYETKKLKGNSY